jgi:hypothetical protein
MDGESFADQDDEAPGAPILQWRELDLTDLRAELAKGFDCVIDALARLRAQGFIRLIEIPDDTDLEPFRTGMIERE